MPGQGRHDLPWLHGILRRVAVLVPNRTGVSQLMSAVPLFFSTRLQKAIKIYRFMLWWSGERRTPALTADTASGAGLQGGTADSDPRPNGDAALAPSEGRQPRLESNLPKGGYNT